MEIFAQAPGAAVYPCNAAGTFGFLTLPAETLYSPLFALQCNVNAPGSNRLNGQSFRVRASGSVVFPAGTYTSAAIQISLNGSNTAAFSVAAANQIGTLSALAAVTYAATVAVAVPWQIEAELTGDGMSGSLLGVFQGCTGTSANAPGTPIVQSPTAILNPVTNFDPTGEPCAQFAVGVTVGGPNPPWTYAQLDELYLEG
jgi:hypothetical protein